MFGSVQGLKGKDSVIVLDSHRREPRISAYTVHHKGPVQIEDRSQDKLAKLSTTVSHISAGNLSKATVKKLCTVTGWRVRE